jgi:hypothetical protein
VIETAIGVDTTISSKLTGLNFGIRVIELIFIPTTSRILLITKSEKEVIE